MKYVTPMFGMILMMCNLSLKADPVSNEFIETSVIGRHDFTLQWLDNFNTGLRGEIKFIRSGNEILAKGYQAEHEVMDYVDIHFNE